MLSKLSIMFASAALTQAPSAPVQPSVPMPNYGSAYNAEQALGPIIPVCQADLIARIRGDEGLLDRVIAGAHLSEAEAARVRDVCTAFDAGAATLLTLIEQAQGHQPAAGAEQQQAPEPAVPQV